MSKFKKAVLHRKVRKSGLQSMGEAFEFLNRQTVPAPMTADQNTMFPIRKSIERQGHTEWASLPNLFVPVSVMS